MTASTITKPLLQQLRVEMAAALAAVAKAHGIAVEVGACSYDPNAGTATFKINIAVGLAEGETSADAKARAAWDQVGFLGLKPEWLGREINYGKTIYTIVGYEAKRSKFPIRVRNADGKVMLLPMEPVRAICERMDAAQAVAA